MKLPANIGPLEAVANELARLAIAKQCVNYAAIHLPTRTFADLNARECHGVRGLVCRVFGIDHGGLWRRGKLRFRARVEPWQVIAWVDALIGQKTEAVAWQSLECFPTPGVCDGAANPRGVGVLIGSAALSLMNEPGTGWSPFDGYVAEWRAQMRKRPAVANAGGCQ